MRQRPRNIAALVIAMAGVAAGVAGLQTPAQRGAGITLRFEGSTLVVDTVAPTSRASGFITPGMPVHDINYALVANVPAKDLQELVLGDFSELGVPDPNGGTTQWVFPAEPATPVPLAFLIGVGLLIGLGLWVGRGQAGEFLRPMAIPFAVATSLPFVLAPAFSGSAPLTWQSWVGGSLISVPASLLLVDGVLRHSTSRVRMRALALWLAASIAGLAYGFGSITLASTTFAASLPFHFNPGYPLRYLFNIEAVELVLFAAVTVGPALLVWAEWRRQGAGSPTRDGARDGVALAVAAVTPLIVAWFHVSSDPAIGLTAPLIWLLLVVVVLQSRLQVETLRLQRDTVVAATEQERGRLAADLHDDALQEMTVLVRRLDVAGDPRSAELARTIADRLREVCGDLRLPILDELGAGPALEWLVQRIGETSGNPVRLDRSDQARPPADVELAVFRVAQEALANAVSHGAPPISVTYAAAADRAALSITDHGAGMPADAASASRQGHYGLLNMRQRAEQIGARISIRRSSEGGTVIGLVWAAA